MKSSPRVRSYDIKRVMEVKRKIQADLEVQSCIGGPLSGSDLGEFATVICNTLPGEEHAIISYRLRLRSGY